MEVQCEHDTCNFTITLESSTWEGKWNAGIFPRETDNKADS